MANGSLLDQNATLKNIEDLHSQLAALRMRVYDLERRLEAIGAAASVPGRLQMFGQSPLRPAFDLWLTGYGQ